jgi:UDP:flavonoid glycosyltransferase YjiC (YdhE family)
MSVFLLCATPVLGHVRPMIQVGADLHARGHRVVILTGSRFAEESVSAGLEHVALPADVDYDERDLEAFLPERSRQRGLGKARYDIEGMFIRTIPSQAAALKELVQTVRPSAVLVDSAFAGALPMLLADGPRPPFVGIGVLPLSQSSRDLAPYGMGLHPSTTPLGHLRNAALDVFMRNVVFGRTQRLADRLLRQAGSPALPGFVLDISTLFDRFLQLSSADFEYPRSDLCANTRLIGSLPLPIQVDHLPTWWGDFVNGRPVVHVTQGTIDNHDLSRLIRPTIEAVNGMDVSLIVTTGGGSHNLPASLPQNVRVTDYLPYAALLPAVDVMVTNGGLGGVQAALTNGIPLIVAGDTEEKPEVAARVAYAGAGINLKTGSPTAQKVRDALTDLLNSTHYADRAQAIARNTNRLDPLQTISDELSRLTDRRERAAR